MLVCSALWHLRVWLEFRFNSLADGGRVCGDRGGRDAGGNSRRRIGVGGELIGAVIFIGRLVECREVGVNGGVVGRGRERIGAGGVAPIFIAHEANLDEQRSAGRRAGRLGLESEHGGLFKDLLVFGDDAAGESSHDEYAQSERETGDKDFFHGLSEG